MLEKFSYEHRARSRPGWVPTAFHEAGVPWDVIFSVFDEMMTAKVRPVVLPLPLAPDNYRLQVPPWHNPAGLLFLTHDLVVLLETWLAEYSSIHTSSPYSVASAFPASDVETSVGKALMSLASAKGAADLTARLHEVQRELRRRF